MENVSRGRRHPQEIARVVWTLALVALIALLALLVASHTGLPLAPHVHAAMHSAAPHGVVDTCTAGNGHCP